jgi:hypothetical protein
MLASRQIPAPQCPACDARLVLEGAWHACPRCGRAFTVELEETPGEVYRTAAVAGLIPVRDPPPRGWGLRVSRDEGVLDVRIGGRGFLSRHSLAAAVALLASLCTAVILLLAALQPSSVAVVLVLAVFLTATMFVTRPLRGENHRLTVVAGRLFWSRMAGLDEVLGGSEVELGRIVGVRDAGDHVAVELDDGTSWRVGAGLDVPKRVRSWLVRRLALLLPPPGRKLSSD